MNAVHPRVVAPIVGSPEIASGADARATAPDDGLDVHSTSHATHDAGAAPSHVHVAPRREAVAGGPQIIVEIWYRKILWVY